MNAESRTPIFIVGVDVMKHIVSLVADVVDFYR